MAFAKQYTIGGSEQLQVCFTDEEENNVAIQAIQLLTDNNKLDYDAKLRAPLNEGRPLTGWNLLLQLAAMTPQQLDTPVCAISQGRDGDLMEFSCIMAMQGEIHSG